MSQKHLTVAGTLDMSIDERIRLMQDVWESIAEVPDTGELSEHDRRMLEERLAAHRSDPDGVIPWDELKSPMDHFAGEPQRQAFIEETAG